jgi:hypothetical protein
MTHKKLSEEMKAVADGLRHVRAELYQLIAQDQLPEWAQPDARTVLLLGVDVIRALEALNDAAPHPTSHVEERR